MSYERHSSRCPYCARFVEVDADGFYDTAERGANPEFCHVAQFCNEQCADKFHGRKALKNGEQLKKECWTCKKELPVTAFCKNRTKSDGFAASCKMCHTKRTKTPADIERHRKSQRVYEQKNKEKIAAHRYVYNHKLTKLPCEICGNKKTVAHHDDYSKPADVRWLCHSHHVAHHYGKLPIKERV